MKRFLVTKKFWLVVVVLMLVAVSWYKSRPSDTLPAGVETGVVGRGQVVEVVSETGFVEAAQSVSLAFLSGGRVAEIPVAEGQLVAAGDTLVKLDAATAAANLAAARARLEAEQVRLSELLVGADTNSLAVTKSTVSAAETALANARRNYEEVVAQQDQLVANAKKTLRSSSLAAYLVDGERENSIYSYAAPVITGTYDSEAEGLYRVEVYGSGALSGSSYRVTGLEIGTEPISTVNPTPLGTRGLYLQFPENFAKRTTWEVPIPNTRSASYLTNLNTYQAVVDGRDLAVANAESAVTAAEAALVQSQSQLNQVSSSARPELIKAQRALVKQMSAAVDTAEVAYNNESLTAPFSGVVTSVGTEVGQIISPAVPVVSLISSENYELKVNISEVDIENLEVGDPASVAFDAYDGVKFKAHVVRVAPTAALVDGVRVFEVTLNFDEPDDRIKDGLSADIDITTAEMDDVIAVPTRAIYEDEAGRFVRVVTNGNQVSSVRITTGLRGSDGQTDVLTGLSGGETIITFATEEALAQIAKP